MARVEAMNLGALQTKGLTASAGANGISSKDKAQQFEQIFTSKSSSQNEKLAEGQAPASQKEFSVQGKDFSKKEDYVADVSGQMQGDANQMADLQTVENEMKQVVKDILGMDDAEFEEAMAAMGIVVTDLLDPSVLQQFVLQVVGGGENIDFLTNEALLQSYNDLFQALTDFMGENENNVMLLMEVLENPVPFEGVLENAKETAVSEMPTQNMAASSEMQTLETAASVQAQTGDQSAVKEQGNLVTEADFVEHVAVQKAEGTEDSMEQGFSSETGNGGFGDDSMAQDAGTLLYADRSDVKSSSEFTNPIFADQMNVVQGNIQQVMDVNMNGLQRMQQMVDIVRQVSEQIRSTVDATATTMEMQLNPESLGKVLLTVSAKDGVMTANFKVQSEEAKQALESQMFQLRETLEAKNLKVESVDVQISNFSFGQSNEAEGQMQKDAQKQGKRKFNFDVAEDDEDMEVSQETPEQMRRRVMLESGGSVDYTA